MMTHPSDNRSVPNSGDGPNPSRRAVLTGFGATVAGVALGKAATAQPAPHAVAARDPLVRSSGGLVATHSRRNGPLIVRGEARFAAEHTFPGMVYGALVFSTVARGTIRAIDAEAARAAPGVVLVMTHENAPRMAPPEAFYASPTGMAGSSLPVMQDASVHWNGQPVAVILADTQEEADYAASLVNISYDAADAVTSFEVATAGAKVSFYAGRDLQYVAGDAEAALAAAPVSVDLEFSTPRQSHNPIEPHAITVAWQDGRLRMHDCTQGVDLSAITIAKVFGLDPSDVHLTAEFVGGGFGGKTLWQYHVLAAAATPPTP